MVLPIGIKTKLPLTAKSKAITVIFNIILQYIPFQTQKHKFIEIKKSLAKNYLVHKFVRKSNGCAQRFKL